MNDCTLQRSLYAIRRSGGSLNFVVGGWRTTIIDATAPGTHPIARSVMFTALMRQMQHHAACVGWCMRSLCLAGGLCVLCVCVCVCVTTEWSR